MLENGLNRLGFSLWSTGTAPGVNMVDPDLNKTIEKLHGRYRTVPELSIQPVEGVPGERVGTHVIHFLSGPRRILSVVVNVDLAAGTADVLSHTTPLQSELEEDAAPDPAEELLKNFGKRKPPTETGAPPEGKPAGETIGDLLENRVNSDPRGTAPLPEAALPAELEAPPPAAPEKVSEEPRKGDE